MIDDLIIDGLITIRLLGFLSLDFSQNGWEREKKRINRSYIIAPRSIYRLVTFNFIPRISIELYVSLTAVVKYELEYGLWLKYKNILHLDLILIFLFSNH